MTSLTLYEAAAPHRALATLEAFDGIAAALAPFGVRLERWTADAALAPDAADADVLAAYAGDVARLQAAGGYLSCDVVRLTAANPEAGVLRAKFLSEHVHDEDEVRFFVEGSGLFYLRDEARVAALECTRGDLIVLPAGTRHWFDTGARPRFTAIRLFTSPDGWAARYTGDQIADAIPLYEGAA